jgi:hypothetical protein
MLTPAHADSQAPCRHAIRGHWGPLAGPHSGGMVGADVESKRQEEPPCCPHIGEPRTGPAQGAGRQAGQARRDETEPLDINSASEDQLKALPGGVTQRWNVTPQAHATASR